MVVNIDPNFSHGQTLKVCRPQGGMSVLPSMCNFSQIVVLAAALGVSHVWRIREVFQSDSHGGFLKDNWLE
ncbi:hypothetical protein TNIN_83731 [Trichonephila inaurata madagascariensis]|uniref:Uncharacterized protein n=1 Tax=Trichonephila inaurata madagascariensis TaxID=2747483 RepID=A0A8X6YN77_9ARAC|nr:hypothetical protein TNIN_83731 [Trichonephila inaurata madagascariensis]